MANCHNCERLFVCHQASPEEIVCSSFKARTITNADRIRSMSDEELANLWWERVDCGECPVYRKCKQASQDCKRLALDWLREEAKDAP
jgi:hypothetical protein